MGVVDSFRFSLGWSRATRIRGLAGVMAKVFGAQGDVVTHPNVLPGKVPFEVRCFAPTAARPSWLYATVGLGELRGIELLCFALRRGEDPTSDKFAWLVSTVGCYPEPLEAFDTLPSDPGPAMALAPPAFLPENLIPNYEQILHARLLMIVPLESAEYQRAVQLGTEVSLGEMNQSGHLPLADRFTWALNVTQAR
jgi:hypothetical protein